MEYYGDNTPYIYEKNGEKLSLMYNTETEKYYEYYQYPDEDTGRTSDEPANIDGATLTKVDMDNCEEWIELSKVNIDNG